MFYHPGGIFLSLEPIKKKRVYQDIIDQIRNLLASGKLKAGDQLPSERELASRLFVSRTAVREAISVLESSGIVRTHQGMGVFVKEEAHDLLLFRMDNLINQQGISLIDLLEVRLGIEGQGAYLAAIRRTDHDLDDIKTAYQKLENAYSINKPAAEEDHEFHLTVVKASQNMMLVQHVMLFSDKFLKSVNELRNKSIRSNRSKEVLIEHLAIYKAIEEKDPNKSQKAMWTHLKNAIKRSML